MQARVCDLIRMQPPILVDRGLLSLSGATVPTDGTDGYQPSCYFQDTTNGIMYVNEGSVTSCDFNALGDLTSVDYSAGGATAITISGTYTVEGISITKASVHGIRVGAFTSGGLTTNAMVLDGTTSTAVEIHAGVSTDPGSGSNLRPLRSRFIVNTAGNVEAETYGMQGQLVVKSSNLGHWHGGVMGTIECQTGLSVYNPLAGVGAVLGRIGGSGITVESSCYLAGILSLASAVSVTTTGNYMGLYVTKTTGATNFTHGAYIENSDIGVTIIGATTRAIDITTSGVFRLGIQDAGVPVSTTYPYAMEVHCRSTADVAASSGSSAGVYTRYEVSADQTTQCNHIATFSKLRVKKDLADGNHVAVYGYVEISESGTVISGTSTTTTAAGLFAIEADTNFELSTGHLNGICIDSSVHASATITGTMAGIRIKVSSEKMPWPTGIQFEASSCTSCIDIACATTPNTNITNHALVIGGRGADELTVDFASGIGVESYEPIQMNFDFTGSSPQTLSTVNIWQGACTLDTDDLANVRLKWTDLLTTVAKACKDVYIHQAEIILAGTTTVSRETAVIGAVLDGGGTAITCPTYSGASITLRGSGTPSNARGLFIHTDSGTTTIDSGIQIQATGTITVGVRFGDAAHTNANFTNAFAFPAIGTGPVSAYTAEEAPTGKIAILVDGATRYLAYWD